LQYIASDDYKQKTKLQANSSLIRVDAARWAADVVVILLVGDGKDDARRDPPPERQVV
jgi:hypothetical protein